MKQVTTHEAKTHLSQLIKTVLSGETVVIYRGNQPVARLTAFENIEKKQRPKVGTLTSEPVIVADDAFSPLNEEEMSEWGL